MSGAAVLATLVVFAFTLGTGGSNRVHVAAQGATSTTSAAASELSTTSTTSAAAATATSIPPATTTTSIRRAAKPAGLRVDVAIAPSQPVSGQQVVINVRERDGDGEVGEVTVDYGDGTPTVTMVREASCSGLSPGPVPSDETFPNPHAYRLSGTYVIKAVVTTRQGCQTSGGDPETVTAAYTAGVGPGTNQSNGPAQPTANVGYMSRGGDGQTVNVTGGGGDRDGFVSRITLDFGDGSTPEEVTYPLTSCDDGGGRRYPASSQNDGTDHHYDRPGTYTARVTLVSVGCDGKDAQQAVGETQVTIPAPPP
jgi:hypothetical protein